MKMVNMVKAMMLIPMLLIGEPIESEIIEGLESTTGELMPFYGLTSEAYGPYEANHNIVNFYFQYKTRTKDNSYERVRLYTLDDILLSTNRINSHGYDSKSKTIEFYSEINLKSYLTNSGLKIKVEIYNVDKERYDIEQYATIYPKLSSLININNYKENDYVINNRTIKFGNKDNQVSEEFSFKNTTDYFHTSNYFKLPLDDIHFTYKYVRPFKADNVYLEVYDPDFAFVGLTDKKEKKFVIPLAINENNNVVSFNYKNVMYVEPNNFIMSLTEKEGYKATHNFYMPKNKQESIEKCSFAIRVIGGGYNSTTFSIPLTYFAGPNLIGGCGDSENCVTGGIRE